MSFKFSVLTDLKGVDKYLNELSLKSFSRVTRRALNKAIVSVRAEANEIAREQRKLKKGEINRDFFKMIKARGGKISASNALSAQLLVSGRPMSMIRFVLGSKTPRPMKGLSYKQRRKIKVEVFPGSKITKAHAFIAKGQNGNFQLFQRQGKERLPLNKLVAPALSNIFKSPAVASRIKAFANQRMEIEMARAYELEMAELQSKHKPGGLK